jgi:hypothetical protein
MPLSYLLQLAQQQQQGQGGGGIAGTQAGMQQPGMAGIAQPGLQQQGGIAQPGLQQPGMAGIAQPGLQQQQGLAGTQAGMQPGVGQQGGMGGGQLILTQMFAFNLFPAVRALGRLGNAVRRRGV